MTRQRLEYHQIIRTHLSSAYLLTEERVDNVLPRFLDSLQELMHRVEEAAESETGQALGRASHAIKGALLNLGLTDLTAIAQLLEQDCRATSPFQNCATLIAELRAEIAKFT